MADNYMKDPRAKTFEGFVTAIEILAKYAEKGMQESFAFEAEHDIIYSHVSLEQVPEDSDDGKLLNALGWHAEHSIAVWAYYT